MKCDELNAYKADVYIPVYGSIADAKVYLKSEADKVIAELKAQKAQAEDDCAYWKMSEGNAANAMHETEEYAMQLYNELRHSKYKRCLAMATFCHVSSVLCEGPDSLFYRRWFHKWYELAEKFKPNSTAQ